MIRFKRILPVIAVRLVRLCHACFRCRRSLTDIARVQDIAAFDLLMVVFYRVLRVVVRNPGTGQFYVLRGHREAAVLYRRVRRRPSAERVSFQVRRFFHLYRRVRLHLFRCRYLRRSFRYFPCVLVAYFELVQIEVQLQYKAAVRRDRSAEHVALMIRVKRILPVLAVCLVRLRHACFRRRRSLADVARVQDIAAFDLLMVIFYRILRVFVRRVVELDLLAVRIQRQFLRRRSHYRVSSDRDGVFRHRFIERLARYYLVFRELLRRALQIVVHRVAHVFIRFQCHGNRSTAGYVIQRPISIGTGNVQVRFLGVIDADRRTGLVRLDAGHLISIRNVMHIQLNISTVQLIIGKINLKDITVRCRLEIRRTTQV